MLQLLTPSASSRTKVHLVRRQVGRSTLLAGSVLALSTGLAFGQTITRNGTEFESVDRARDAQVNADGSLTFTDGSGRELTVRSGQYVVSNNQVFIREDIFNALFDGVAAAGGGSMGAILGVVGGLVLVGALASGGGGGSSSSSDSTPTPAPDTPPTISSSSAVSSQTLATGVLHTVSASDEGNIASFAITGGADAATFNIDANGQIAFSGAVPTQSIGGTNDYVIEITVTDNTGKTTTQTLTLTLDDTAPTFGATTDFNVDEGVASVTTIAATDTVSAVTYSFGGGVDDGLFSLDAATGVLTFIAAPDYENAQDSVGGNNVYDIIITATDAAGNTANQAMTVTVDDVLGTIVGTTGAVTEGDYDTMVSTGTFAVTGGYAIEGGATVAGTYVGTYGTLVMAADGSWTYKLDKSATVTALDVGDVETDSITITTDNGTATIEITINGAETGGVFTGGYTADLTEGNKHDAVATATGTVVIDDLDTGDTAATVTAATGVLGLYGSLDIDASGNWTYTLDQSKVQWLRDGEDVTDRLYVTLSDGTEQAIEITIEGDDEFTDIDDPYYASQWHLTDMEAAAAWERATGYGVGVGVFDDGVESDNTDLVDNYDSSKHQDDGGTIVDGYDTATEQSTHGTSVAGIISATGQNNTGGVGVAFNSDVTGVVQLFGSSTEAPESEWVNFDVANNSWGSVFSFSDDFSAGWSLETRDALIDATSNGRGGLGTIITFATGNARTAYVTDKAHAQDSDITTSRYSIAVTGHSESGFAASYAQRGHSVLVSGQTDGIHTTDRTDNGEGYNSGGDGIYATDLSYNSIFNGTSAATPMVTGIAALILDINPDLGWRDVKDILATAATYTGSAPGGSSALEDFGWQTNGATTFNGGGFHISGDYGFGAANAKNAVALAETWLLTGQSAKTSLNEELLSLSDTTSQFLRSADADGVTFSFTVNSANDMLVEYISVDVDWEHNAFASDFQITLIAPNGTKIILADPEISQLALSVTALGEAFYSIPAGDYELQQWTGESDWTFGVETMRGVAAEGTWGVQIIDTQNGYGASDTSADIDAVNLNFYGTVASNDTTYYYTDEFFLMAASDASRSDLIDADGIDTINAAAVTGDLNIDGAPGGGEATIGLSIGSTTIIENFISGSGDDTLTGNTADNKIWGREGADTIDGAAGADTIDGGLGDDVLTGGDDADVFVFTPASGADEITDFKVGVDSIELHGYGMDASDIYDMLSFDGSGNVIFDTGTDSITLTGITCLAGIEDSFTLIA